MVSSRPRSLRTFTFGSKRRSSPEPPSPTFSDATHVSAVHFGPNGPDKIMTRTNLKTSVKAYENLVKASTEYRAALLSMAKVTAAFADALEQCSGLKGPSYDAGTRLQAASGLHHLIGNHWHVLAETMDKKFEKPLRQHLDTYRTTVHDRSTTYEKSIREKSQLIRDTEMRSMNRRERNLQSFREALNVLQRQVDELDDLKATHYREIIDHEEKVWDFVQSKTCIVVRSTMDMFDRFTAKASDPVLEVMLQTVPDPFDSYGPPPGDNQIFSILAPLSIMTSQLTSPSVPTSLSDYEIGEQSSPEKDSTWLPSTSNESESTVSSESTEWARVGRSTSPVPLCPRSVSPPPTPRTQSPAGRRISTSGLRNMLTIIDETAAHPVPDDLHTPNSTPPPADGQVVLQNDTGPRQQLFDWSIPYGVSPYENTIPRNSILFPQPTDDGPVSPEKVEQTSVVTPVAS